MQEFKKLVILIAEDDDGHAELISQGLKNTGICNEIVRFENGQQAVDYLNNDARLENGNLNQGYLLLLDINMPIMDGVEVLKQIKADDILKKIPVIMLTTTDDPREIEKCYSLGCSIYVTKPIDFLEFADKLTKLGLFVQIVSV